MSSEILLTSERKYCIMQYRRERKSAVNKINYQKELDKTLERLTAEGRKPSLLLHACCAPCSSYVLEYLSAYFEITLYFYNPNIAPREEYEKREEELRRLCREMEEKGMLSSPVRLLSGAYEPERFTGLARGREALPEGGERCFACYALRLGEMARAAKEGGFDYMTTTLSISPYKNAEKLNELGRELERRTGISYLYSDFKKRNGYHRSIVLSEEFQLYRQDYCGCIYSRAEREQRKG